MSKILNIKKIRPMFNAVITTFDVFEDENTTGLIGTDETAGNPKPYQKVIAVGPAAIGIHEGDLVAIDFTKYAVKKHKDGSLKDGVIQDNVITSYAFNTIKIDGKECLFLHSNDILFIIDDAEEVDEEVVITTDKELVC